MRKLLQRALSLVPALIMVRVTNYYSLAESMKVGPDVSEVETRHVDLPTRIPHIFHNRMITKPQVGGEIFRAAGCVVDPDTGNVYWKGTLLVESSGWPPQQVLTQDLLKVSRALGARREIVGAIVALPSTPYYHWLLEDLPATLAAVRAASGPVSLLVNKRRPSYVQAFLEFSNLDYVEAKSRVASDLVIFSNKQGRVGNPQLTDLELLRSTVTPPANGSLSADVLYVSRLSSKRSLPQEIKLISELEQLGIFCVELEGLGWLDQVRLFKSAKAVIGPHGAGLANLVFCDPGVRVIEILDINYPNNCFEILAGKLDLDFDRIFYDSGSPAEADGLTKIVRAAALDLVSIAEN